MSTTIQKSQAFITFVNGELIQDVQILIDNRELYNALPGKLERRGIKTLASWPIFVTAILKEIQSDRSIREAAPEYQLSIFDFTSTANPTGVKARKRKVERTLAEIRKLHEDLNAQLYTRSTERPVIHSPADAYTIIQPFLASLDHEELWVVNLDTRNRVMSLTKLYQGSVNTSQVRVGEVYRQAIIDNAPAIVVSHNHPSSDCTPSPEDVAVTRAIVSAGKLLDIDCLDHLIVSSSGFVSLKERGLGFT